MTFLTGLVNAGSAALLGYGLVIGEIHGAGFAVLCGLNVFAAIWCAVLAGIEGARL
jgi:hypothetical protein